MPKLLPVTTSFRRNERGNVAMIFALALIPMLIVAGFAIDAQLAFSKKDKIQYAVDSAVLAGARMMQSTSDQKAVTKHSRDYFAAIMSNENEDLTCDTLVIDFSAPEEITGNVTCYQPTTLMNLIGRTKVQINTTSVATYGTGRVDVSFVFDVSGSMNSWGRIYDLKEAAKAAAETLLPEPGSSSDGDVRIAMVAYNSMVNAGPYFEEVTGLKKNRWHSEDVTTTEWEKQEVEKEGWYRECDYVCTRYAGRSGNCKDWDYQCEWEYGTYTEEDWVQVETTKNERKKISSTCVYERGGDHAFDNAQPEQIDNKDRVSELGSGEYNAQSSSANTSAFLAASHLYWNKNRERWYDNGDGDCLNIEPFPLSHNATQIEKYIDNLYASGGTAGHQGVAWGWYLISEEWGDIFTGNGEPLSQSEPDVTKAMIVMTDGEFNSQFFGGQGNSTKQAKNLCDAIKEDDVIIYTVAFQAPQAGKDVLSYCASGPEFYFNAENGQELMESYNAIATSISDLRISF
ncbi:Tad domain-containing protein [Henriciella mobilis]|uniref:VWA domain-containing protein n=1 Tax=Henriciella mobilis TaxID=2305467 RepID=A0A399RLH7_9PROT|nr:Tad domain-containing protein [Henriciella mobilis]RIJ16103.1 VWA domain-containing protein [Henriciella mobilis]RIJ22985.1 VWA domain-containing protein [Henriciella mobilis]RIJ32526.1 VWA domain-containing protein [Henriciella mobilis]